jgi:NAD(P)-dependent dehydrogenase (short-subunit alcohol dehydrogenase family)
VCLSKASRLPEEIINENQDQVAFFSEDLSTAYKEDSSKPLSTIIKELKKKWSDFKIDAFIHNAGVLSIGPADQLSGWRETFEVNLFAAVGILGELKEMFKEDAKVIIISSGASEKAYPSWASYCCSKASVNMLVACLAKETSYTCLAVRPGVLDTEMQKKIREDKSTDEELKERFTKMYQNNQLLSPDVPAKAIVDFALHADKIWNGKFVNYCGNAE